MALLPEGFSFSRKGLPIIAIAGLVAAALFIWAGMPDRKLEEPDREPPRATGALANEARVAGAGVVEPSSETIEIGTAIPGLVTQVLVKPGDYVTRGQPLFIVDTRAIDSRVREAQSQVGEAQAAIAEAEAGIAEARAAEATAARQLDLYRNIGDPAAVSRSEVIRAEGDASAARERRQLAQARASAARARLQSAQALVSSARTERERATVRAPISGEILAVNIRPGEYLSTQGGGGNAEAFIAMGETRPLHIRIDIDEEQAPRVALGEPALVSPRGAAGRQVKATFVRAEPQVVPKRSLTNSASERVDVRVLQVIYELPQTDGLFRVGQQVDAFIPARKDSAE
ncbi:efflux RND transporter periplasmic adaptor subunit [Paraurantiacibacter namhicola]|uniref:p-hydroxybenzoic acid efflux pump subunit AaeA n=1 Tax=Paraurantiacibacter namhicola TaxID=645517 RepID=A0A1C7D6C9_9SPHN|nr:biotin/lipoyl-binding protein [Paraurantiacibacter namhicola]ANU07046.1 p-hydroxybenzoic acid efflux pump subunit AaeA [Paraurantiacibacter namhicola]